MEFCEDCGIPHPSMHGLTSDERVTGVIPFEHRGLTYDIWSIHHKESTRRSLREQSIDGHWWCWARPTGKTKELIDFAYRNGFVTADETYYVPGYTYREEILHTQELALKHAKETITRRINWILDGLVSMNRNLIEEKQKQLKIINTTIEELRK